MGQKHGQTISLAQQDCVQACQSLCNIENRADIKKKKKSSDIFPSKETTERLAPLFFIACGQREQCGHIKGTDKVKQDLMLWTSGLNCPTHQNTLKGFLNSACIQPQLPRFGFILILGRDQELLGSRSFSPALNSTPDPFRSGWLQMLTFFFFFWKLCLCSPNR